jgi:vacuolar-type H+-ATPase subunit F/Vma7
MERYRSELDELTLAGWFNPDFTVATDKAAQHEKAALICLQAMYVKSVTAQFRCAAPNAGRVAQAHHDLQGLKEDLRAWYESQESFARRFEERIQNDTTATFDTDDMKEIFDDEDTLSAQRREIINEANKNRTAIIALHDDLDQMIDKATDHASQQLSASSEPLTLVVKLNEQNEIEQVSKLTV